MNSKNIVVSILQWIGIGGLIFLMLLLMFLDLCPWDESFYLSQSYRFVLGNLPFKDVPEVSANAALLINPLVRIFIFFKRDTSGLVLFTRIFYYLVMLCPFILCFKIAKKYVSSTEAMIVPVGLFLFPINNVPNFSYNSLGMILWCFGVFLSTFSSVHYCTRMIICGSVLVVSAFCYPALIVGIGVFLVGLLMQKDKLSFSPFILGLVVGILLLTPVAWGFISEFGRILNHTRDSGVTDGLVSNNIVSFFSVTFRKTFAFGIFGIIFYIHKRGYSWFKNVNSYLFLFLPIACKTLGWLGTGFFTYWALCAIPLYLFNRQKDAALKTLFYRVVVPSLFAGFAGALGSEVRNLAVGFWPAAVASTILYFRLIEEPQKLSNSKIFRWLPKAQLSSVIMLGILFYVTVSEIKVKMAGPYKFSFSGPFAGLFRKETEIIYENNMTAVVRELENDTDSVGGSLLFYPEFPGAYLFAHHLKPATARTYSCNLSCQSSYKNLLGRTFVIRPISSQPDDFTKWIEMTHKKVTQKNGIEGWKRFN